MVIGKLQAAVVIADALIIIAAVLNMMDSDTDTLHRLLWLAAATFGGMAIGLYYGRWSMGELYEIQHRIIIAQEKFIHYQMIASVYGSAPSPDDEKHH